MCFFLCLHVFVCISKYYYYNSCLAVAMVMPIIKACCLYAVYACFCVCMFLFALVLLVLLQFMSCGDNGHANYNSLLFAVAIRVGH